jgi:nucleotide-binding universal stress UspA family protein
MLRTILVPLDGSKFSESSLPLATEIARAAGAKLYPTLVHVPYEPEQLLANTPFQFEGVDMAEYDAHRLERDREYMAELGGRLSRDGVCTEARVVESTSVADALAAHAALIGADLILMASHGHSGVSRAWLGSVADRLVRHSVTPLLVTRPRAEADPGTAAVAHILVPLDGSDLAERALGPAAELARATGARLTLAHVISVITVLGPRILPLVQHELEPELERAATYLERVADRLRADGLDVATHAVHGKTPPLAMSEMADKLGVDVIAMASHGYGGLKRAVLGSVADKLLRVSSLPVLITRPGAAA